MAKPKGTYTTPEERKDEFREYLRKSKVIEAISKVLVALYEEPDLPSNAMDYLLRHLGSPSGIDIKALQQENMELKEENAAHKKIIEELTEKNDDLEKRIEDLQ